MSTFFLEQKLKTKKLDSILTLRQFELDLMAQFMEFQSINPNIKQKQIAKE